MKPINLLIIMHALMVVAFVVCITFAAIHLNMPGLLWWYLVSALLTGVSLKESNDKEGEQ